MRNIYANLDIPTTEVLHGVARLHTRLAKMDGVSVTTRGWTYNDLVSGCINSGHHLDPAVGLYSALEVLWDTMDAISEIGANAVDYLKWMDELK